MLVARELIVNFILFNVVWAFAYLIGGSALWLFRRRDTSDQTRNVGGLCLLVTSSATGLAIVSFLGYILASIGLLYAILLPVAGLGIILVSSLSRGGWKAFWQEHWRIVREAVRPYTIVVYFVALYSAARAVLPDTGPDTQQFHLTYPYEWAIHHHLVADMLLRIPYDALNWQMLYAWFFTLGIGTYSSLLVLLTGVLTLLGIQALLVGQPFIRDRLSDKTSWPIATAALVLAPLAFQLSPAVLRWETTSFLDVPFGFFLLAIAICTVCALREPHDPRAIAALVICGGFFVGMKVSFLAFSPLILGLVIVAAHAAKLSFWKGAVVCGLLVLTACPWYTRNFVLGGDPAPPLLNIPIVGKDSRYDRQDYDSITAALEEGRQTENVFTLPYDLFMNTTEPQFAEYGVTVAWVFLYVPLFALALYPLLRKRLNYDAPLVAIAAIAAFGVFYWMNTAIYARYTLVFGAVLCAFLAILLVALPWPRRVASFAVIVGLLVLAVPTPSTGLPWLQAYLSSAFGDIASMANSPNRQAWQARAMGSSREIAYLSAALNKPTDSRRIYDFAAQLNLQMREAGLTPVGDFFGLDRYNDLAVRVGEGHFAEEVRLLNLDGVLISGDLLDPHLYSGDPHYHIGEYGNTSFLLSPRLLAMLQAQAIAIGFRRVVLPGSNQVMLVRP